VLISVVKNVASAVHVVQELTAGHSESQTVSISLQNNSMTTHNIAVGHMSYIDTSGSSRFVLFKWGRMIKDSLSGLVCCTSACSHKHNPILFCFAAE
jgi:hypothetical protein